MRGRRVAFTACVILASLTRLAFAEPYIQKPGEVLHLNTPSTVNTDGGSTVRIFPGYFFDDISFSKLDSEMRRLQEAETRLKAENSSLRKSAKSISFGWYALGTALAAGLTAGYILAK